jgi:hypothetical protein
LFLKPAIKIFKNNKSKLKKMKQRITIQFSILFFFMIFLAACSKKDIEIPKPAPGQNPPVPNVPAPINTGSFSFHAMADLTGQPYHSSNLHAVVSIEKASGEQVITDSMLVLNIGNPVKTATLQLPEGDYKLTSFRMVYGSINTHFATPFAGSSKANGIQKPLKMDFKVTKNVSSVIPVEVLKVQAGDKPQHYGYASGAFDNGQADASPFFKIKMKAVMQIGDVTYDSIPASLSLTTWNDKGEMTTTYGSLKAGINEIQLLKAATKFQFVVSKWGVNDNITLNRNEVDENTVYILGGSKEAKKLKSERVYKIIDGKDVADTKTDYHYDHLGNLLKIDYWMKKADNSTYFAMADWFEYSGGRVSKIKRVDIESNTTLKETIFTYNAHGKIVNMVESADGFQTTAAISYLPAQQNIAIQYNLPSGHSLNYNINFVNGNMSYSTASNSNGSLEQGSYSYDFSINPYLHMNWPTLFMNNISKNNITYQQKQSSGSYATAVPYSFFYKYDNDGYPVEVIKNYKTYPSGSFGFSTKTVFVY